MSIIPNSFQEMWPPPNKTLWLPATETTLVYSTKRFIERLLGSLQNRQEGWRITATASSRWLLLSYKTPLILIIYLWLCWVFTVALMLSRSCIQLFVSPWTIARQVPLSTGFPRQGLLLNAECRERMPTHQSWTPWVGKWGEPVDRALRLPPMVQSSIPKRKGDGSQLVTKLTNVLLEMCPVHFTGAIRRPGKGH